MDSTPINGREHQELKDTINAEIKRLDAEDKRLNARLEKLETNNDQINTLTLSVQRLTDNIEQMRQLQEDEGKRLTVIEGRDGEMWRKVVGYIITFIAGIILTFIFSQIGF